MAQPLRAALTGRSTSPGIFDVLVCSGREESLARIGDQAHGPERAGGSAACGKRGAGARIRDWNILRRTMAGYDRAPRARLGDPNAQAPLRIQARRQSDARLSATRASTCRCRAERSAPTSSTSASSTAKATSSPTTPASPRPRAARARSPISTATKAFCSIAAIRSISWPSTATSSRSAICCCTANCRRPSS